MLSDLEARWQQEKTPQVGLRLAEVLHRQGDRGRAEEILDRIEEMLAPEPRDLASRVALGGLRLAMDQPAAAARALEQVVARDATHLKANKLLVEVYLELGRRQQARDRLDLYRLLNEGDPEIEALEGLLVGEPVAPAAAPPAAPPAAPAARAGRTLVLPASDPFAALTAAAPATAAAVELLPPSAPPAATATLGELYREQGHADEAARIFRDVLEDDPANARARAGLEELGAPPAAAEGFEADTEADRRRRVAVLRDYLSRLQRARRADAG